MLIRSDEMLPGSREQELGTTQRNPCDTVSVFPNSYMVDRLAMSRSHGVACTLPWNPGRTGAPPQADSISESRVVLSEA